MVLQFLANTLQKGRNGVILVGLLECFEVLFGDFVFHLNTKYYIKGSQWRVSNDSRWDAEINSAWLYEEQIAKS